MAKLSNYKVVSNAALRVKCGTADEMMIRGLQSITLPIGFTTETTTVSVMGERIAKKLPTGGEYEDISIDYAWAPGDKSQAYMRQASLNNTEIRDMRFYVDDNVLCGDFAALDLISDSSGCYRVGSVSSPSGSKNDLFTGSLTITPAGPSVEFSYHAHGTDLEFDAASGGATCTSTNQDFVEKGFEVGMTVIIDKLDGEDPIYAKIKTVTSHAITFEENVGDEARIPSATGAATTAMHGAFPMVMDDGSLSCD